MYKAKLIAEKGQSFYINTIKIWMKIRSVSAAPSGSQDSDTNRFQLFDYKIYFLPGIEMGKRKSEGLAGRITF